jgi:hypothetical protein
VYVQQKRKEQEEAWRAEYRDKERQRLALETAARVQADRDGTFLTNEQRQSIETRRRANELKRPTEFPCEVCGQTMPHDNMVTHWINGRMDRCIRNPKKALKLGYLTEDQFSMIPPSSIDTGFVFEGIGTGDGDIQSEQSFTPGLNPLAHEQEYRPVKHLAGGV